MWYLWGTAVVFVIGVVVVIGSVIWLINNDDDLDLEDIFFGSMVGLLIALIAAAVWPLTVLAAIMFGIIFAFTGKKLIEKIKDW